MWSSKESHKLKNGKILETGVVTSPDVDWWSRLSPFLGHKGDPYIWQMKKSFEGGTEGLEVRSYIGLLDGQIVANISTMETHGAGVLAHVFTSPEVRGLGIAKSLMDVVTKDFDQRNGEALILGTGYNSPAYWIYHGFGFRGLTETSGSMERLASENVYETYFSDKASDIQPVNWSHWGDMALLAAAPGSYIKLPSIGITGRGCYEDRFLKLMKSLEEGNGPDVKVAIGKNGHVGAVLAITEFHTLVPSEEKQYRLDIFGSPNFEGGYELLLGSSTLPKGKVLAFLEEREDENSKEAEALERAGFKLEGRLINQVKEPNSQYLNVSVYGKRQS